MYHFGDCFTFSSSEGIPMLRNANYAGHHIICTKFCCMQQNIYSTAVICELAVFDCTQNKLM